jgi:hypothetical protein
MADAGARAAWLQAVVTTFWTKLGYMTDPEKVLQQLEDAQASMQAAMHVYLVNSAAAQRAWAKELAPQEQDHTSDQAQEAETQEDETNDSAGKDNDQVKPPAPSPPATTAGPGTTPSSTSQDTGQSMQPVPNEADPKTRADHREQGVGTTEKRQPSNTSQNPPPGLEVIPREKKARLPRPDPPLAGPSAGDGFVRWSGPAVAVVFDATTIEEKGARLLLHDGNGDEVVQLDKKHLLQWEAL